MILCLSGGVGGAKLVLGLNSVLDPGSLVVAVNTGDDFFHCGLEVWPDFDTALYTLAGLADPHQGWGRAGETWRVMDELKRLGGESWFNLGDMDIALHLLRAQLRDEGLGSTDIASHLRARFGVAAAITPATDQIVRTIVHTDAGVMAFQRYFVRERARPRIVRLDYEGAESARMSAPVLEALRLPVLEAIIIAPSNPFLSIDPILAISGARAALRGAGVPIIAVTPIIAGAAVKGPTAKIMNEFNMPVCPAAVAAHYGDLIDGFVLDSMDGEQRGAIEASGIACLLAHTLMRDDDDKIALAKRVLEFARNGPRRSE